MIRVDALKKLFRTSEGLVPAVNGISFHVPEGTFFTLLGPSGCGKTTTLRCLAGLERPDQGEIRLNNQVVYSSSSSTYLPANRRAIGMVFQSYAIWPHMTVFDNVAYPLRARKRPGQEIRKKVMETLELVGMASQAHRPAPRLSGGQQQRVALARAIVGEPSVLLLDEPLSNLDAKLRSQMRTELKRLQRKVGVTAVYVTHDQQEALALSDQVAVMNGGEVIQLGTPEEIYLAPRDRFTASFIGTTNFLQGRNIGSTGPGLITVETEVGPLGAIIADPALLSEQSLAVSIRPEWITVNAARPESSEGQNVLQGRVTDTLFLGEVVEYDVLVGQVPFHIRGNPINRLSRGDVVYMTAPIQLCTAVRGDSSAGPLPSESAAAQAVPQGVVLAE